jgi:hypothetical protein
MLEKRKMFPPPTVDEKEACMLCPVNFFLKS